MIYEVRRKNCEILLVFFSYFFLVYVYFLDHLYFLALGSTYYNSGNVYILFLLPESAFELCFYIPIITKGQFGLIGIILFFEDNPKFHWKSTVRSRTSSGK